jgi:hypothetical protein
LERTIAKGSNPFELAIMYDFFFRGSFILMTIKGFLLFFLEWWHKSYALEKCSYLWKFAKFAHYCSYLLSGDRTLFELVASS